MAEVVSGTGVKCSLFGLALTLALCFLVEKAESIATIIVKTINAESIVTKLGRKVLFQMASCICLLQVIQEK